MDKITGVKDLDIEILTKIEDKKLSNIWNINKYFYYKICDDSFLKRRLTKYPGVEKYKYKNQNQKNFFTDVSNHIFQMKKNFDFSYSTGDFRKQCNLLKSYGNINDLLLESTRKAELPLMIYSLNKGADIRSDADGIIYIAVDTGCIEIVDYLVKMGCSIIGEGDSCLRQATTNNNLGLVKYLVEKGARINLGGGGISALTIACDKGYNEIVHHLIEQGANIHYNNNEAVKIAVKQGYFTIVQYLIEHGAIP